MNDLRARNTVVVFALMVAIGVVGRWGQPDWCVTPMAAIGLLAGSYFGRWQLALCVPLVAMAISDIMLASSGLARYERPAVFVAVYGSMALAAAWGTLLRRPANSRRFAISRLAACSVAPAIGFFLITNLAVWATGTLYTKNLAGLAECYTAALPFFRRMIAGDIVYTATLFGMAWAAGAISLTTSKQSAA